MLPFATKTDMVDALKKADVKISDIDAFLALLRAEHDAAGARAQLKTLWTGHVRALLQEEAEVPVASGAPGGGVRARAQTPPLAD